MIDEINTALRDYFIKWQGLVDGRTERQFFADMKPTAVGWKVADRAEYVNVVSQLFDRCGRVHETRMNDRWIAKLVLDDLELEGGIIVLKVMERRPHASDALGLDHVDFYAPDTSRYEEVFKGESHDLKIVQESNDAIDSYSWTSIWFDGTEAKIKPYTVLGTVADDLRRLETQMLGKAESTTVDA